LFAVKVVHLDAKVVKTMKGSLEGGSGRRNSESAAPIAGKSGERGAGTEIFPFRKKERKRDRGQRGRKKDMCHSPGGIREKEKRKTSPRIKIEGD